MTTPPLDLNIYEALCDAAPALIAMARERDQLMEQMALRTPSALELSMQEIMRINNEMIAEIAHLREALEAAEVAMHPYVEWGKEGLTLADSLKPDLYSFDDDCEVDVADDVVERSNSPLLWGDLRRLRDALAKVHAALGKEP